jgi:3-deoxy-D-manno-octulosonic-acid transferase
MMFLYSIGIRIYGILIFISSIFNKKAALWIRGRRGQFSAIKSDIKNWGNAPIVIVHAASYGEYEMSKPIIEDLRSHIQNLKIIVSFFSPSGYTNVSFEDSNFMKIYLPLDTQQNQKKLIDIIKPKAVIFIKYDFWFNLLTVLKEKKVPYYFTSLHLNQDSYLFRKIASPFLKHIRDSKIIFAHNNDSKEILELHNFNNVKVIGDTRIDKAIENKLENYPSIKISNPEKKLIIIGSLTDEDIEMVSSYINSHPEYNHIIAPHDIYSSFIQKITDQLNLPYAKYTENKESNILIINTLGDLKYLYRFADIAYVGGGFSKGPHNIIEPLVYGVKVFCGPNIKKFPMAVSLSKDKLLHVMESKHSFGETINILEAIDSKSYKSRSDRFISNNQSQLHLLTKDIQAVLK